MSEIIRTFIAIEMPPLVKSIAREIQDELKPLGGQIVWTKASGMHLTLKFLGDTYIRRVDTISQALSETASKFTEMELSLTSTGAFGGSKPRVLWLGLEASPELMALQSAVEDTAETLGFPKELRPFHPHLTLGRIKNPFGCDALIQRLKEISVPKEVFKVNELVFFKSDLQPAGAVYTRLKTFNLAIRQDKKLEEIDEPKREN